MRAVDSSCGHRLLRLTEKRIDIRWRDLDAPRPREPGRVPDVRRGDRRRLVPGGARARRRRGLGLRRRPARDRLPQRAPARRRAGRRQRQRLVRLGTSSVTRRPRAARGIGRPRRRPRPSPCSPSGIREARTARPIIDDERAQLEAGMSFNGTSIQNRSTSRASARGRSRRGVGGAGARRSSIRERSTTSQAGPAARRRCAPTARPSSAGGIRPRMLTGNTERDLSVDVLGTRSPAPFLLAPVGVLSIAHAEGELAAARAAAALRIPFMPLDRRLVIDRGHRRRRWATRRAGSSSTGSTTARSSPASSRGPSAAGFSAIVVTLDTPILGWRPRDLRNAYLPFITRPGLRAVLQRPRLPREAREAAGGGHARRRPRRCSRRSRISP